MGDVGRYWILYVQPEPESGERIAAALVFEDNRQTWVDYDRKFSKVHKMYPSLDIDTLSFYVESVRRDVVSAKDLNLKLASYGPQVVASSARRVATPISDATISLLRKKYILPERPVQSGREWLIDEAASEIEAFVRSKIKASVKVISSASSRDLFGRAIPGTKRVAVAIQNQRGWTLFDGVDLNKSSPKATISRADEIARTFWHYTRAEGLPDKLTRVGIVLNGSSLHVAAAHEAHDYALHRFTVDSDLAVDAASPDSSKQLTKLLAGSSEV